MSGPDRRDTRHNLGFTGGVIDDQHLWIAAGEEYYNQIVYHRRAYHVQADVQVTFAPDSTAPANYHVQADVEAEFKARDVATDWNDQVILGAGDGVRMSRAEHTRLDVADELEEH